MNTAPRAFSESNPQPADVGLVGKGFMPGSSLGPGPCAHPKADADERPRPPHSDAPTTPDREWRGLVVRAALDQLPEVQRSVVAAVYFGGHSQSQVAAEYGLPLRTVNRHLFLGLRQLGTVIDESLAAS